MKFTSVFRNLLILLSCASVVHAQSDVDSLFSVWQDSSIPDSTRVEAFKSYIWDGFLYSQPDSAFVLAEEMVSFSKAANYPRGEAIGLRLLGVIYRIQGDYGRAVEYYQRSLQIAEEFGAHKEVSLALNNIGNVLYEQDNYPAALDYYRRSLKINEETGGKKEAALALNNIGNVYFDQGDLPGALLYYQRSLKIREELGDRREMADDLNNIGVNYSSQGDYTNALLYFQRSLKIREELGDQGGIATSLYNIGSIHEKQGQYPLALEFCTQALELAEAIGLLTEQKGACQCIYDTYKAMGKGNDALVYLEKMNAIADSLKAKETVKKLQQMEFAKQALNDSIMRAGEMQIIESAHQAEVRKKNKTRNMLAVSGFILLLISLAFFSRWRYVKKSRAALQIEKNRSDNLLLNILPEEIAQELMEKGRAEARDFDMVSILFTDFKSFTETSATLTAGELVEEINHCFEAFDAIVEKYGVEKIKTIGDAYMAAGGLPVPGQDSVKNTVQAAFEMQEFVAKRKSENTALGKPAFEMRIGINTGPVVAGIVGVKKFQYDIWGDTVNTASRMESAGETGKVNISQSTYEFLKEDPVFTFEYRGKLNAKGKGEIDMWFVSSAT